MIGTGCCDVVILVSDLQVSFQGLKLFFLIYCPLQYLQ